MLDIDMERMRYLDDVLPANVSFVHSSPYTIRELLPRIADIRRFGGAAIDCCSVAAGRLDAYYEVGVQDWDVAAGRLLVHEAGGLSRDFRPGLPFVCGSPSIFDDLLAALGLRD